MALIRIKQVTLDSNWTAAGSASYQIKNIADPTANQDVATKAYVDNVAAGLDPKESVRFATLDTITGTYVASGGTGGTGAFANVDLTDTGDFDLDGNTVQIGDRILIKNQASATQNGIYVVTAAGAFGAIERASDHDGSPAAEVSSGNFTFVELGATYAGTGWVILGDGILTLNTDAINWTQFSDSTSFSAGDGINIAGSTISADINTAKGLEFDTGDGNSIAVNIDTNSFAFNGGGTGAIELASNVAGDALSLTTGQLDVLYDNDTIKLNSAGELYVDQTIVTTELYLGSDSGTAINPLSDGDTITIAGGEGIATGFGAPGTVIIDLDIPSMTHTASDLVGADLFAYFDASDGQHEKISWSTMLSAINTSIFDAANFQDGTTIDFTITAGTSVTAEVALGSLTEDYLSIASPSSGSNGQILASDGAGGFFWTDASAGDITSVVAGAGLTGGGAAGDVTLNIGDGAGITVNADSIEVNVDNSTITINSSDQLEVADAGIGTDQLNAGSAGSAGNVLTDDGDGTMTWVAPDTIGPQPAEYRAVSEANIASGNGVIATDPFGSDTLITNLYPAVYINGVKYSVGNGTTSGVDCWFAASGVPGTALAFGSITNASTLVWSVANSGLQIDTADVVNVVYQKQQ